MKKNNKEIDPIITLILAYLLTIGILIWWASNVSL